MFKLYHFQDNHRKLKERLHLWDCAWNQEKICFILAGDISKSFCFLESSVKCSFRIFFFVELYWNFWNKQHLFNWFQRHSWYVISEMYHEEIARSNLNMCVCRCANVRRNVKCENVRSVEYVMYGYGMRGVGNAIISRFRTRVGIFL